MHPMGGDRQTVPQSERHRAAATVHAPRLPRCTTELATKRATPPSLTPGSATLVVKRTPRLPLPNWAPVLLSNARGQVSWTILDPSRPVTRLLSHSSSSASLAR